PAQMGSGAGYTSPNFWLNTFTATGKPHFYAPLDVNGWDETTSAATPALTITGSSMGTSPYSPFPSYSTGYGNASAPELANHPSLFNPLAPFSDDRLFALSNMEALLRYGDTGASSLPADLLRLCPNN